MRARLSLALCLLVASAAAQTQELYENQNAAAVLHALRRLPLTVTVLHTTAHPDDEDAALLTWLSRYAGARTGLFTLTRGEGGANLIGPEMYDALGVLRTEELLAAGRYYGVDQFFTRAIDFGFSKRMDETLEHWSEETVLRDAVRVIRTYQPDIVIARFHGAARDGHGNHQTAGYVSAKVFQLAADPQIFPELAREGLQPWQVKKLYLSVRENEPSTLKIDTGIYDPLLGRSYRELGRAGYAMHRSQSMGGPRPGPGPAYSAVRLVNSTMPKQEKEETLFDGLDSRLIGLAKLAPGLGLEQDLAKVQAAADSALAQFDARRPEHILPQLVTGLRILNGIEKRVLPQDGQLAYLRQVLRNKHEDFNRAVTLAMGVHLDVLVDPDKPDPSIPAFFRTRETFNVAVPGQTFTATAVVTNRSRVNMENIRLSVATPPEQGWRANSEAPDHARLGYNEQAKARFTLTVGEKTPYTRPYWSRRDPFREHVYQISSAEQSFGLAWDRNTPIGELRYDVDGVMFTLARPVQTVSMLRPVGEQRRQLTVAPALSVQMTPRNGVVRVGAKDMAYEARVNLLSNVKGEAQGTLRLQVPAGWRAEPAEQPFHFTREGEQQNFRFRVTVLPAQANRDYTVQAVATLNGKQYTEGYQVIQYPDLEPRHVYHAAATNLRGIDVKVSPNLQIGYIMGVGDEVPDALEQIGVKVQMLGAQELASADLSKYDTILVGIRASAVRPDLKAYNRRLLDYVQRGGNLVWQYQTPEFDQAPYGPYPFQLTPRTEEVSEEDAKVTILDPQNPMFQSPNRITPTDFDGWVEERGSKFMMNWDPRYTPLLESHDRRDPPQKGGLLQTKYGKGTFTYCAYAFYRQLPAGVPGAYRLFANLISLGKTQ